MPLKIRTHLDWKQKTREGRHVLHFDKIVSIDDLTGLSLGLKFQLKFETDYDTDPEVEIKIVDGTFEFVYELLNSVHIHIKCVSGRHYANSYYNPDPIFLVSGFKGQLISKCLFCVFNSPPKKEEKQFDSRHHSCIFSFVFWEN
jgi:hypothetical protein